MIIRHINRFFSKNSKWVFGIFTVVIIISFVDFFSPQGGLSAFFGPSKQEFGSVYGHEVTVSKMQDAYRQMRLLSLLYGRDVNPDNDGVFRFIALGEAMNRQGIAASDDELIATMRQIFSGAEGKYSQEAFDNFMTQIKRQGFTGKDVDDAVRRLMAEEKLRKQWMDSIAISDGEIEALYKTYNQKLNTRVRLFVSTPFQGEIPEEELQNIFNNGNYVKPASAHALIVEFADATAARDFATAAYNEVSPDEFLAGVFEKIAKERNLTPSAVLMFSETDSKVGKYESVELVQKLINPEASVIEYTIKGGEKEGKTDPDKFLVAIAFNLQAARPYDFEEVKTQVLVDARVLGGRRNALLAANAEGEKLMALPIEERLKAVSADAKFNAPIALEMSDSAFGLNTGIGDVSISATENTTGASQGAGFAVRIIESIIPADMAKFADSKEFIKQLCLMQKMQTKQMEFWREIGENCQMAPSVK